MSAPTSKVFANNFNGGYISKNSAIVRNRYQFLFNKYGDGLSATDLLETMAAPIYVPANPIVAIKRESPVPVIKVGSEIAVGAAGAAISFDAHADSLDTNSKPTVRERESILIPAKYLASGTTIDKEYLITDITGTTITAYPMGGSTADVDTAIPVGTELQIGATAFARGTDGTTPKMESYSTDTYYPRLLKEALGIEGAALAHETELELIGSDELMLSGLMMKAEFRFDKQKDFVILNGELMSSTNDNMDAISTNFGGTNTTLGTKGLLPTADEQSMDYAYASALDFNDLDALDMLFESRGVSAKEINAWMGSQVVRDLRAGGIEFTEQVSQGTDLYDKTKEKLGFGLKAINWGERTYTLLNPASFNSPAGFALQADDVYQYMMPTNVLFIPKENVTMKEFGGNPNATMPNVQIAYVNHNGEDRSNVFKWENGVTNITPGMLASGSFDGLKGHWLCEMFMIIGGAERWIYAHKS